VKRRARELAREYTYRPAVASITLNRCEALNALSLDLLKELNKALMDFQNDELLVTIITGAEGILRWC